MDELPFYEKNHPNVWREYFHALGLFMFMFSRVESDLNAAISVFVNERIKATQPKDQAIIRALLGGQRIAGTRDTLKRLLRVVGSSSEDVKQVNLILDHLGEIHFFRDRLAHNGAVPNFGIQQAVSLEDITFSTTNSFTSREFDQIDTISFTLQDLKDMARDLEIIPSKLSFVLSPKGKASILADANSNSNGPIAIGARHYLSQIQGPWRYKPSRLKRTGPIHDRNRQ